MKFGKFCKGQLKSLSSLMHSCLIPDTICYNRKKRKLLRKPGIQGVFPLAVTRSGHNILSKFIYNWKKRKPHGRIPGKFHNFVQKRDKKEHYRGQIPLWDWLFLTMQVTLMKEVVYMQTVLPEKNLKELEPKKLSNWRQNV
ncbi:uncharacterized protein LOC113343946 [Papaver somniferum]|uniref:uncharacterized protein LOC113343946 n=1 Tax=Papaver somniferum TaxID=3469 RepID=UPI000E702EEA|nr:uncharacterized protein LOC113343946 [Papaver somniferum]